MVVHSSAHDKRRQKRLERELKASLSEIQAVAKAYQKKRFFCRADDEAGAADDMAQSSAYHQLKVHVQERPRYGRGRPKHDGPRASVAIEYALNTEITEKGEAIAKRRQMVGCFELLTNVAGEEPQGYSAEKILRT